MQIQFQTNKLIIIFVKMQIQYNQIKPILLLDDILTFFDKKNHDQFIEHVTNHSE